MILKYRVWQACYLGTKHLLIVIHPEFMLMCSFTLLNASPLPWRFNLVVAENNSSVRRWMCGARRRDEGVVDTKDINMLMAKKCLQRNVVRKSVNRGIEVQNMLCVVLLVHSEHVFFFFVVLRMIWPVVSISFVVIPLVR